MAAMSLRVHIQPVLVFFGGLRREEPTKQKAAAAAEVALVVVRPATPKTWPRSTPKTTETGDASHGRLSSDDQNRSLLSLVRCMLCWQLLIFVSVSAGVVISFRLHLFTYALLTTAL